MGLKNKTPRPPRPGSETSYNKKHDKSAPVRRKLPMLRSARLRTFPCSRDFRVLNRPCLLASLARKRGRAREAERQQRDKQQTRAGQGLSDRDEEMQRTPILSRRASNSTYILLLGSIPRNNSGAQVHPAKQTGCRRAGLSAPERVNSDMPSSKSTPRPRDE